MLSTSDNTLHYIMHETENVKYFKISVTLMYVVINTVPNKIITIRHDDLRAEIYFRFLSVMYMNINAKNFSSPRST